MSEQEQPDEKTMQPRIRDVFIEDEMKTAYMDYSMSVIISRALPDVRDGLKPSQRRILVAMNDLNLSPGRGYRKCAKIAGDTSGNYHPHGEQVIYPTLVRMAQNFSMRYPLVNGQGNFGSVDGDPPAAMRYTEARMMHATVEMLTDLDKETVDFTSNYDETRKEPTVLPSRFPNLLCNGSSGIAVGMSTNIPPHNLNEIIDGMKMIIDQPDIEVIDLVKVVKGPDFPTAGIIYGRKGIFDAYTTGRGLVIVRARAAIEEMKHDREMIVITEIPYQVNKNSLIEKFVSLVKDKRVEGISDIRDESDRKGMRIIIELKRNVQGDVVLNKLYKYTQMQDTFGVILLALVDGQPKVLTLKQMMTNFIDHRHEIIVRRTKFELAQAEHRAHILEGLRIALDNIDAVISTIRESSDPDVARASLIEKFKLSEIQANAILQMRLQRLTGLEREKIDAEYALLLKLIEKLSGILDSRELRMLIIKDELDELKKKFGDERRTEITDAIDDFNIEDLIAEEDMVITISHQGYIKRLQMDTYRQQNRGGKGIRATTTKDEDFVEHLFVACTHEYILFFTNEGRCHWLKVFNIPEAGRLSKGKPIVNCIEIGKDEHITAFIPIREFDEDHFLMMATQKGIIKKTALSAYSRPRKGGINAITLQEGDSLIDVKKTDGSMNVIIGTAGGKAIRFPEEKVRSMGRTSMGVKGISLGEGDSVVGLVAVKEEGTLLVVTEKGYGKRTAVEDYRTTGRGGKGIITMIINERNGKMVSIMEVVEDDDLLMITKSGILIRTAVGKINIIGRNTQGVRLINLSDEDQVIDVTRIPFKEEEEEVEEGEDAAAEEGSVDGDVLPEVPTNETPQEVQELTDRAMDQQEEEAGEGSAEDESKE